MGKTKKPAISREWRENKQVQERAEKEVARQRAQAERAKAWAQIRGFLTHILTSAGWVVALAAAGLLALALLSYSPTDPGFSTTGTERPINVCGIAGAWTADFLFWLFGRSSYWLIAFLVFLCSKLVRMDLAKRNGIECSPTFWRCFVGLGILMTASVGLDCLQLGYLSRELPLGAGGLAGQSLAALIVPYLGVWGSSFVLLLVLAVGMSLAFRFSWFDVAERIGTVLDEFAAMVRRTVTTWIERKPSDPAPHPADEATAVEKMQDELQTQPEPWSEPEVQELPDTPVDSSAMPAVSDPQMKEPIAEPVRRRASPSHAASTGTAPERIVPALDLLEVPPADRACITDEVVQATSRLIETKLRSYRIEAKVVGAQAGPVITQYWLELAPGVKGSAVEEIRRDLTRALAVPSVRVVPVIPGKPYMGLEIPNGMHQRMAVYLSEIIGSPEFEKAKSPLSLALGKDIAGKPMIIDLAKLPHLLVGGTTGSGKSVCINTMILSLLYKSDPANLRLVLIDPKTVEFSLYQDIPHLLCPVVVDMNKAAQALNWLVREMDHRYALMSKFGARSFETYNEKVAKAAADGTPLLDPFDVTPAEPAPHTVLKPFPYIVCFIDELADLILVNRKQVEAQIMRLAQKARAAGIHMVLATQRPSVDIVTPLIKANIVARICFQVGSRFDSQVVLDESGAQELLGRGDMLFKRPGSGAQRIQGCMVEENEVLRVVDNLKAMGEPDYVDGVTDPDPATSSAGEGGAVRSGERDPLYDQAVAVVLESKRASISFVQRRLNVGYNRAANLLESMEQAGVVSAANAAGKREILVKSEGGVL